MVKFFFLRMVETISMSMIEKELFSNGQKKNFEHGENLFEHGQAWSKINFLSMVENLFYCISMFDTFEFKLFNVDYLDESMSNVDDLESKLAKVDNLDEVMSNVDYLQSKVSNFAFP